MAWLARNQRVKNRLYTHAWCGREATERALRLAGFGNVYTVPEQREPDGDFPTVNFPNPEEDGAMDLALKLAKEVKADLVFANDPDADRLAVALPNESGEYVMLTGNEIGVVLGSDLINAVPEENRGRCSAGNHHRFKPAPE